MRRQRHSQRDPEFDGSERSIQLGTGLGIQSDPSFIEAILHAKAHLDDIGGQVYIAPYRVKVNSARYEGLKRIGMSHADAARDSELEDYKQPGHYVTLGYLFQYDHLAKFGNSPVEPDETPENARELPIPDTFEPELTAVEDLPEPVGAELSD